MSSIDLRSPSPGTTFGSVWGELEVLLTLPGPWGCPAGDDDWGPWLRTPENVVMLGSTHVGVPTITEGNVVHVKNSMLYALCEHMRGLCWDMFIPIFGWPFEIPCTDLSDWGLEQIGSMASLPPPFRWSKASWWSRNEAGRGRVTIDGGHQWVSIVNHSSSMALSSGLGL